MRAKAISSGSPVSLSMIAAKFGDRSVIGAAMKSLYLTVTACAARVAAAVGLLACSLIVFSGAGFIAAMPASVIVKYSSGHHDTFPSDRIRPADTRYAMSGL